MELVVESSHLTDSGRRRPYNEDYISFFEPQEAQHLAKSGRLYLLADGAGGRTFGQAASRYAVQKVLYEYYRSGEWDLGRRLSEAFAAANRDIFRHARERLGIFRMGTTLVAAAIRGNQVVFASVGNSQAFIVRGGRIERIIAPQAGKTGEEKVSFGPYQAVQRLGLEEEAEVELYTLQLGAGHILVLCTDGLLRHVSEGEIARLVTAKDPQSAARELIRLANKRGGQDNISVIVIRMHEAVAQPSPKKATAKEIRPIPPNWEAIYQALATEAYPGRMRLPPKLVGRMAIGIAIILLLACGFASWRLYSLFPRLRSQQLAASPPLPSPSLQGDERESGPLIPATPTSTSTETATPFPTATYTSSPSPSPAPTFTPTSTPSPTTAPLPTSTIGVVNNPKYGGANVRAGPGLNYEILDFISDGAEVEIIGRSDLWYNISWPDRSEGAWIYARLVRTSLPEETPTPTAPIE